MFFRQGSDSDSSSSSDGNNSSSSSDGTSSSSSSSPGRGGDAADDGDGSSGEAADGGSDSGGDDEEDDDVTGETSSSSCFDDEDENDESPSNCRNKPLPRHKPQLVAPELRPSAATTDGGKHRSSVKSQQVAPQLRPLAATTDGGKHRSSVKSQLVAPELRLSATTTDGGKHRSSVKSQLVAPELRPSAVTTDRAKHRSCVKPQLVAPELRPSAATTDGGKHRSVKPQLVAPELRPSASPTDGGKHRSSVTPSMTVDDSAVAAAAALLALDSNNCHNISKKFNRDPKCISNISPVDDGFKIPRENSSKTQQSGQFYSSGAVSCSNGAGKISKKSSSGGKRPEKRRDLDREFDKLLINSQTELVKESKHSRSNSSKKNRNVSSAHNKHTNADPTKSKINNLNLEEEIPILIGRGRRKFKPLLPYKIKVDSANNEKNSLLKSEHCVVSDGKRVADVCENSVIAGNSKDVKIENVSSVMSTKESAKHDDNNHHSIKANNNCHLECSVRTSKQCDNHKSFDSIGKKALLALGVKLSDVAMLAGSIRPTIADLVKVRERRKSFERDTSSGSEWERKRSSDVERRTENRTEWRKNSGRSSASQRKARRDSRKLSNTSLDSNSSSCLSESLASDTDNKELCDLSNDSTDSVTQDDDAEPGGGDSDVLLNTASLNSNMLISATFGTSPSTLTMTSQLPLPPLYEYNTSYLKKLPQKDDDFFHINNSSSKDTKSKLSMTNSDHKIVDKSNKSHIFEKPRVPSSYNVLREHKVEETQSSKSHRERSIVNHHSSKPDSCTRVSKMSCSRSCRTDVCGRSCCYYDGSSSDSDDSSLSDQSMQVDLDSEQTQTFSVSENNFNQVSS